MTPVQTVDTASLQAQRMPSLHAVTKEQALEVGKKFEAMFLSTMMQQMFTGLKSDGMFGGGQGEEMFRPMLIEQYGKMVADHGRGIGIADAVARTLLHAQEAHQ